MPSITAIVGLEHVCFSATKINVYIVIFKPWNSGGFSTSILTCPLWHSCSCTENIISDNDQRNPNNLISFTYM